MAGRVVIGTSSWADPGFVEEWYPGDLPARERLRWYAERFEAVEVNSTFYAVPSAGTARTWARVTPDAFTFDVKLHRLLSRHAAEHLAEQASEVHVMFNNNRGADAPVAAQRMRRHTGR
jgi:uncharacterized protein YecE (DUF72 family)